MLSEMSVWGLRYILRHPEDFDRDYHEAAQVEWMQRKLMGTLK